MARTSHSTRADHDGAFWNNGENGEALTENMGATMFVDDWEKRLKK